MAPRSRRPKTTHCAYCGATYVAAMPACPQCNHATSTSGRPLLMEAMPQTRPFWQEILHAFVYPLTPFGVIVIVGTGVLMAVLTQPGFIVNTVIRDPRASLGGLVVTLALTFYFFEAVQTSAGGTRWFPKFAKSDLDWYETLFFGVEGTIISYLPDLAYVATVVALERGVNHVIFEVLRALGCLYLPMGLLALAVWRDGRAVLPQFALPLIRKIPVPVLLSAAVLWAANSLHLKAVLLSLSGGRADLVGYAIVAAAYLYFVAGRIIGIAHWVYRKKIGWFRYD